MMTPDFSALMASLLMALMSWARSMISSFLKEFVNRMSPIAPSVMAGQKTGILFFQAQQQMLSLLLIFSPILAINLLGVKISPLLFCYLYNYPNRGSRKFSNLIQVSLVTRILPILQCPLSLFCLSSMVNAPSLKLSMHFMMSSSMPPADVTMQSTILCYTKQRMVSLMPDDTILEVQPKNTLVLILDRQAGSEVSSSSLSLRGSSESRQEIMRLMIRTASAKLVA